ncbi:hypothetical protein B9G55_01505 [Saccharibacillus sp. O16]|nr:hypothetical protein B9G55_01505 [Saccharibacillus sp. O16]
MRIVAYDGTKDEEERIVAEQLEAGYYLVEIQNIIEGDYLGFAESPLQPTDPEDSELQKVRATVVELEQRTKLLEYAAQTTGETLDVHEGAIFDVTKLALGGSPEDL